MEKYEDSDGKVSESVSEFWGLLRKCLEWPWTLERFLKKVVATFLDSFPL